jgi:Mg-chelatase subunit ChlD
MTGLKVDAKCLRTKYQYDEEAETTVLVSLQAEDREDDNDQEVKKDSAPLDLVVVLDRSGSMSGKKLDLCKQTCRLLTQELREQDRFGLVAFDSTVDCPLTLQYMNEKGKKQVEQATRTLRAGSTTNLSGGLFSGIDMLKGSTQEDEKHQAQTTRSNFQSVLASIQNNISSRYLTRSAVKAENASTEPLATKDKGTENGKETAQRMKAVLLLTDGQANCGVTRPEQLVKMAGTLIGDESIRVFTFGYGSDHNDELLKKLADGTGGSYYFIEGVDDVPAAFADCLGGLVSVAAQNVSLSLRCAGGAAWVDPEKGPLTKFKWTHDKKSNSFNINIPDIYGGETKNVLANLKLPCLMASVDGTEDAPVVLATVRYIDCIEEKMVETQVVAGVARPEKVTSDEAEKDTNEEVLAQMTRVETANEMEVCLKEAREGRLGNSRARVQTMQLKVQKLKMKNAKFRDHGLVSALEEQLTEMENCVSSEQHFRTEGACYASRNVQQLQFERASAPSSDKMNYYQTKSKAKMAKKWTGM